MFKATLSEVLVNREDLLLNRPIEEVIYPKSYLAEIDCKGVPVGHTATIDTIRNLSNPRIKTPSVMGYERKPGTERKKEPRISRITLKIAFFPVYISHYGFTF